MPINLLRFGKETILLMNEINRINRLPTTKRCITMKDLLLGTLYKENGKWL